MKEFKALSADAFDFSPFKLIAKDWMLITAQSETSVNTMTASWGGLGYIWNKNAAYIVVRKSRFTKGFIDESQMFSLSFFDTSKYRKMLNYMGTISGRDEAKIEKAGLTVAYADGIPYFEEASKVLICKVMCRQTIEPSSFILEELDHQFYSNEDYHDLYIGEIVEILVEA